LTLKETRMAKASPVKLVVQVMEGEYFSIFEPVEHFLKCELLHTQGATFTTLTKTPACSCEGNLRASR
jgi:hypothetical protein